MSTEEPGHAGRLPVATARVLAAGGFDLIGVASPVAAAAAAPRAALPADTKAVIVLGAGRAFFGHVTYEGPDPLDTHTDRVLEAGVQALRDEGWTALALPGHRPVGAGGVDLVALGRAAGLGWESRLGLLLHPERGPWWSLRGAIATSAPLASAAPLAGPGPCHGCPAPCQTACPAGAPRSEGFDVPACGTVRAQSGPCDRSCAARRACVVGTAHSYDLADEHRLMEASREALLEAATARNPIRPGPG